MSGLLFFYTSKCVRYKKFLVRNMTSTNVKVLTNGVIL